MSMPNKRIQLNEHERNILSTALQAIIQTDFYKNNPTMSEPFQYLISALNHDPSVLSLVGGSYCCCLAALDASAKTASSNDISALASKIRRVPNVCKHYM